VRYLFGLLIAMSMVVGGATTSYALNANENLVVKAVKAFHANKFDQSMKLFTQAEQSFPENYSVNYFLGVLKLKQGNKKGAVQEWLTYLDKAPNGKNSLTVRKHLTVLQKIVAKQAAVKALKLENRLGSIKVDPQSVAVSYFRNIGSNRLDPLQKGMTEMLITDLSQVKGLKLVERVKVQALLQEMQLSQTGLVTTKSRVAAGKMLKADKIISGAYSDLRKKRLNVSSSTIKTDSGKELGSANAKGPLSQFWRVEKQLTKEILTDLGYSKQQIPSSVWNIHTKNLDAFKNYSYGLDDMDNNHYDNARAHFRKAIKQDPNFELAQLALLAVPVAAVSISAILSSSASAAPSASVAAASVSSSVAASAAATTVAATSSGMGMGTMGIIGAAGAGLVVANNGGLTGNNNAAAVVGVVPPHMLLYCEYRTSPPQTLTITACASAPLTVPLGGAPNPVGTALPPLACAGVTPTITYSGTSFGISIPTATVGSFAEEFRWGNPVAGGTGLPAGTYTIQTSVTGTAGTGFYCELAPFSTGGVAGPVQNTGVGTVIPVAGTLTLPALTISVK